MKFLQSDPQCMETGFIPVLTWIAEQYRRIESGWKNTIECPRDVKQ